MKSIRLFHTLLLLAFVLAGCNEHAPLRENANALESAQAQSKLQELSVAEAIYVGKVRLIRDNSFHACILRVWHTVDPQKGSEPTETIQVPKLKAMISFPEIDSLSQTEFWGPQWTNLRQPLGQQHRISVDYADYNPNTKTLTLPYTVTGYADKYGAWLGQLDHGHLTGTWTTAPLGDVAIFDLVRQ